ncbi:unnamed protein product [Vitrella brassicaformis CCMP3155]|uniref:Sec-independent protein translocase protein TatA n=2 Tax=Vitrella brassicaformis TaxID=1169539 RepID=A0A0G4GLX5_VITBC|nr:unnamed protein product [Vitrella brassicaformis CCMP3155]|eukprot:CEM31116.1 unnamed protein product [Vitrella brassicaformis CCMP3155]
MASCSNMVWICVTWICLLLIAAPVRCFVPPASVQSLRRSGASRTPHIRPHPSPLLPPAIDAPLSDELTRRTDGSPLTVRHAGFFGLGPTEIVVIVVAAGLLLGPEKVGKFARDLGKIAGELKEVPKEFQQGISDGENVEEMRKEKVQQKEAWRQQLAEMKNEGQPQQQAASTTATDAAKPPSSAPAPSSPPSQQPVAAEKVPSEQQKTA